MGTPVFISLGLYPGGELPVTQELTEEACILFTYCVVFQAVFPGARFPSSLSMEIEVPCCSAMINIVFLVRSCVCFSSFIEV